MRLNDSTVSPGRSDGSFEYPMQILNAAGVAAATPTRPEALPAVGSRRLQLRPQWQAPAQPFRHTWEGVINVDQFRWMVRRDMQEQLELARRELRAKHVRAVGMYDDEMRAFCPSPAAFMGYESKEPRSNWQIIDYVMDSLLDRGLQPMFTTSFTPGAMASGPLTVFSTRAHTSPPKDWKQWADFVTESVAHAVDRYSLEVVRQWYFEVWNEPNLHGWFWGGDQAEFFRLWQTTHQAIKAVNPHLRVGGPSCARAEWIDELLEFGAAHGCAPDYLVGHIYNNDSSGAAALAPFAGAQVDQNSTSPDAAIRAIRQLRTHAEHL
jgi:xylan 1,4-beta-xylosidase